MELEKDQSVKYQRQNFTDQRVEKVMVGTLGAWAALLCDVEIA